MNVMSVRVGSRCPWNRATRRRSADSLCGVAGFEPLIAALLVNRRVAVFVGRGQDAAGDGAPHDSRPPVLNAGLINSGLNPLFSSAG
jgi:hypothetical protein